MLQCSAFNATSIFIYALWRIMEKINFDEMQDDSSYDEMKRIITAKTRVRWKAIGFEGQADILTLNFDTNL